MEDWPTYNPPKHRKHVSGQGEEVGWKETTRKPIRRPSLASVAGDNLRHPASHNTETILSGVRLIPTQTTLRNSSSTGFTVLTSSIAKSGFWVPHSREGHIEDDLCWSLWLQCSILLPYTDRLGGITCSCSRFSQMRPTPLRHRDSSGGHRSRSHGDLGANHASDFGSMD